MIILAIGQYKLIEKLLITLVLIMSTVFIITAIVSIPDLTALMKGLFIPQLTSENSWPVIALIGTTIVPYNLFLHASAISQKWTQASQLSQVRKENVVAVLLGGFISMAIVITGAATVSGTEVQGLTDMAAQLEPLLGSWATYFLGIGLFAAGISSAITAPLAAAYAAKGIFGWSGDITNWKFKLVWLIIILIGISFSLSGYKPIEVIQIAQVANGILLPIIALFLLRLCNNNELMGEHTNNAWQNMIGILIICVCILLSFKSLNGVFNFI